MAIETAERFELHIDGMTCAACSSGIQKRLSTLDAVTSAQVNYATGRASVVTDGGIAVSHLEREITALGYAVIGADDGGRAEVDREADLRQRLIVAAVLTIPAMAVSMLPLLRFDGWELFVAALVTPVILWSGWPFHFAAWKNLRHGSATMDTLVSLGSLAALFGSVLVFLGELGEGHVYFETGAVIVTLILLGKWLELRAKRHAGDALRSLADLGAKNATLVDGSQVPLDALAVGMRFLVRPGEKVSTDGVVIEGRSAIDTSVVTGEPVPVEVAPGDDVIGATINTNGSLVVEATKVGAETMLAQIIELVDQAQSGRADVQRLADRVAGVFVPVAIIVAAITFAVWSLVAGVGEAVSAAIAVLIIACPCALGLATPLAIMVGTGRGAQLGVIIKGGEVLEDTRAIDAIVLDKTGTITEAKMQVVDIIDDRLGADERSLVHALAAAVESQSEHPIAEAIARSVDTDATDGLVVAGFLNMPGKGVRATVNRERVHVGRRSHFSAIPEALESAAFAGEQQGSTAVFAGRDGEAELVFVVADRVKETSAAAIAAFRRQGLDVTLLTGDNARTAEAVAALVGIDTVIAEVYPNEKAETIASLQADGRRVAMVGDGINDAPALALADLGIAIGTGTDVAIEASDLTVVSGDLLAVADAIALSRRTLSTIKGNLFWAFAYNAAAIPLAALGVLHPMIAAAAMGLSSLFVVSNSLRLRQFTGHR